MFSVNQKVVCVDPVHRCRRIAQLTKNTVYVVRDCGEELLCPGEFWVLLRGIHNISTIALGEIGYDARRFRLIAEKETNISIFTAMLKPSKVDA